MQLTKSRRGKFSLTDNLIFVGPLLFFVTILYGTLLWTIYVSFADWKTIRADYTFQGFKWYNFLVNQPRFWVDIQNNLKWLILGVIPTIIVAILIAYVLELSPYRGVESYTRTLILYPVAMSFVVTGTIWSWIYQPEKGVINTILGSIGIDSPLTFTNNPAQATYWLILIFVWQYLGFAVIISLPSGR